MQNENIDQESPAQRRASPRLVVEARQALGLVKPYLARMGRWQIEAARLRARLSAHQSSGAERDAARIRLVQLQAEAEDAHGDLMRHVPPGRPHSRIEDTSRALLRFADLVRQDLRNN